MPPAPTLNVSALAEGSTEAKLLSLIQSFDDLTGAPGWAQSSRLIGFVTCVVLFLVVKLVGKAYGVNWCSLLHAVVVGSMSAVAVYINTYASEALTGTPEPLAQVLCQGPLTTFHSIVPAITMGYGFFDIAEGMHLAKADFIMHGLATLSVMSYFCEYGVPEIIMPMLLMEISTVNLNLMGAKQIFSERMALINVLVFSINFTIVRVFICPYLWWEIFSATWEHRKNPVSQACLPWHFTYVTFVFGMFFNCLNAFWFVKIVKKIQRKLSGAEKWKNANHVKES